MLVLKTAIKEKKKLQGKYPREPCSCTAGKRETQSDIKKADNRRRSICLANEVVKMKNSVTFIVQRSNPLN